MVGGVGMEAVSAALLAALAGGLGGAAGAQAWAGLRELVVRPFRRAAREDSGADALAGLADAPDDAVRAEALAAALADRAAADPLFAAALDAWHRTAQTAVPPSGGVTNTVSGGTQSTVVQARDIHGGLHFGPPQGS